MSNTVQAQNVNVTANSGGLDLYIGCAISCSFTLENDIIGKTTVTSGLSRRVRVRRTGSRANVTGVVTTGGGDKLSVFYFLQESVRRSEITFKFTYEDDSGNDISITMVAVIQSISLNAEGAGAGFAEFDMQLEGTGTPSFGPVEPPEPSACPLVKSDYWNTTPGATSISGASANAVATTLAGKTILYVDREGMGQVPTVGVPGNREYRYTGTNLLETDANNPYNAGETIFIIWEEEP